MKKTKTIDNSLYDSLFERLWSCPEEESDDDEIRDFILETLQEELERAEPICGLEDEELRVTRLSILNTVINAFLPGYRLVLEVDQEESSIGEVYLAEV